MHTAQAYRSSFKEVGKKPDVLWYQQEQSSVSLPTQVEHNPKSHTFILCAMYQLWDFSGSSVDAGTYTCILYFQRGNNCHRD